MLTAIRHTVVLLLGCLLLALALAACGDGPSEADIEATVVARIEEEQAEDAALEAKAQAQAKAMVEATAQAVPTATPVPPSPTPTVTPVPPSPTPTATHTPAPDPYIALSDVRQKMGNLDSYHADLVTVLLVDGPGLQVEMRFDITHDYESPDKARMHLIAEILGERVEVEAIRIGNTGYTKEFPSTEWTSDIPDDDDFEIFRPVWEDSYLLDRDRVRFVGFEDLDGVSVYHFATDDPSAAAQMLIEFWEFPDEVAEGSTKTDLWVNAESHLIERIAFESDEIDASIMDFPSTATLKVSFDLDLSAFNEDLPPIVAPTIPTPTPTPTAIPPVSTSPKQYAAPPMMMIDPDKSYTATFQMQKGGEFTIELYPKEAPVTVNNFVFLARDSYYDGTTFHRVIEGFMAQGGDPTGTGTGGPGYTFDNEPSPLRRHDSAGTLSMANSGVRNGKGTNGSQFFITFVPTLNLDGNNPDGSLKNCARESCHTVFGRVIEGMDVVNGISRRDPGTATRPGDVIKTIKIVEVLVTATPTPTPVPPSPTPTPVPTYTIIKGQILDTDTTWSLADSPYRVEGNIKVNEGVTLTVEPGVAVWFVPKVWLDVYGTLRAIGTEMQPITFSGDEDWRGLRFKDSSADFGDGSGSWVSHAILRGSDCGSTYSLIRIEKASPGISNNTFDCGGVSKYEFIGTVAIYIESWGGDLWIESNVLPNQYIRSDESNGDGRLVVANNTLGGIDLELGVCCDDTHTNVVVIMDNSFGKNTHKDMGVTLSAINVSSGNTSGGSTLVIRNNTIDLRDSDPSISGIHLGLGFARFTGTFFGTDTRIADNHIMGGKYGMSFYRYTGHAVVNNIIEGSDTGIFISHGPCNCNSGSKFIFRDNTLKDTNIALHFREVYWGREPMEYYTRQTEKGLVWEGPTISNINFINVGTAVLLEDFNSDLTIPISDSYWETTDLEAIGNLITDNADDYTLGTVSVVNPVSSLIDISAD